MVDAMQNPAAGITQAASRPAGAAAEVAPKAAPAVRRARRAATFQQTLDRTLAGKSVQVRPNPAIRQAVLRPVTPPPRARTSSAEAAAALTQAMAREGVPESWRPGLEFIMHKESRGQIDARNPVHSARGLFQLTRVNYHLNPRGEASFGNGVEEAQGGIRYIRQRYGTPDNAVAHFHRKGWY
jgi:hypothetical protein